VRQPHDRALLRLAITKRERCLTCIARQTKASGSWLKSFFEHGEPGVVVMGGRCEDCRRLGVVYTIR
jgi:hypothetical protein